MKSRWIQLAASVLAMIMIANLQYAWTLFVNPIQTATHWKLPEIQYAFALFVIFETWAMPFTGWLIDLIGPRALAPGRHSMQPASLFAIPFICGGGRWVE